jgi:hypothetical protein
MVIPRQRTPGEWMSLFIYSTDLRSSVYPDILKTRTSKIATTTSTIAAIIPITKLSGLYPLFQHTFEIQYANVNDATIYTPSALFQGKLPIMPPLLNT